MLVPSSGKCVQPMRALQPGQRLLHSKGVLAWAARQAGGPARRYYHPAPPARAVVKAERTFEGISLDTPGSITRQVATMSRFQLCPACYEAEARRAPQLIASPPCCCSC